MTTRPASLAAAAALLVLISLGSALMVPILVAVAASELVGPDGPARVALLALALVAASVAATGIAGAIGLWLLRSWGWLAGLVVALATGAGAIVAVVTASPQPPVLAGLGLTLGALLLVLAHPTRRAVGIS